MPYDLPSEAVEDAATETDERVWTCEDHQFRFPAPTVIHEVAETAAKIEEEIPYANGEDIVQKRLDKMRYRCSEFKL